MTDLDDALDRLKTCQDLIIAQIADPARVAAGMERTVQKWPSDDDLFIEKCRAELAALRASAESARLDERERCAKIAEEHWYSLMSTQPDPIVAAGQRAAAAIEKSIRSPRDQREDGGA